MSDDDALRELYILKSRALTERKQINEQRRQKEVEFRRALAVWQKERAAQADMEADKAFIRFMEKNTAEHAALVEQYDRAYQWGICLEEAIVEYQNRGREAQC
jgi:hypothetical protein